MEIYLAGPISLGGTLTQQESEGFINTFTYWEDRFTHFGHKVVNPCKFPKEESWERYMRHGLRAVSFADALAMLPRWLESSGATLEAYVARRIGIPVYDVEQLHMECLK